MQKQPEQHIRPSLAAKARELAVLLEQVSGENTPDDLLMQVAAAGDVVIRALCDIRSLSLDDLALKLDCFFRASSELWDAAPLLVSIRTDLQRMIDGEPSEGDHNGRDA